MKRLTTIGILLCLGGLSVSIGALQVPQTATKVVNAEKLADNLYLLTGQGGGGNTAVFIGANGVIVVDTKNPGWGMPILDKIKELTPKPITTIINTHTHGDHVSGNVEFPTSIEVVVQENTKTNMEKMTPVSGANQTPTPSIFTRNGGRGLPKRSFKETMTIGRGADQVDLYYFGRGHTNGDAFVVFPALRVMHAGDMFPGKNLPFLDTNNGGSAREIGNTLLKAANGIRNVDRVITGHSTVMTVADLREYAQFNSDFLAAVQAELRAGKSVDDIVATWKLDDAKYKGYTIAEARLKSNVEVVANELK